MVDSNDIDTNNNGSRIVDPYANRSTLYQYIHCLCGVFHGESQRGQRCSRWPYVIIGSNAARVDTYVIDG